MGFGTGTGPFHIKQIDLAFVKASGGFCSIISFRQPAIYQFLVFLHPLACSRFVVSHFFSHCHGGSDLFAIPFKGITYRINLGHILLQTLAHYSIYGFCLTVYLWGHPETSNPNGQISSEVSNR